MIDRVAADTWCPVEYYSRRESPPMNHSIIIPLFSTCPQLYDPPRRTKDSPGAQLHPGSRDGLYVQVEEKIEFFTLWHFYGGNGAMARWMSRWWNFSMMAKTPLGAFVFYIECRFLRTPENTPAGILTKHAHAQKQKILL
eukprot:scaffold15555_cov177-Skeletonema_dohrnii-CCMP3373.AAC.2